MTDTERIEADGDPVGAWERLGSTTRSVQVIA
jgi:hypothetical protein